MISRQFKTAISRKPINEVNNEEVSKLVRKNQTDCSGIRGKRRKKKDLEVFKNRI